jgi:methylenetetrahydrofolate--tRNA-(uracil-5-)-methyltransferase
VESAAIGLLAGRFAAAERRGETIAMPPRTTAHGALLAYITGDHVDTIDAGPRSYQPMNVNFGLFPPLAQMPNKHPDGSRLRGTDKTIAKRRAVCARALADLDQWIGGARIAAE